MKSNLEESSSQSSSQSNSEESSSQSNSESNSQLSDTSQQDYSSEIEFNIISESNPNLNDFELFLEQSRIFSSLDSLDKSVLQCISVKSDDTILSFVLILKYENLLKLISKNFKKIINKVIESNLVQDQVKKKYLSLIYTERACDLEPSLILEIYKKIEINEDFIYIILSRVEKLDKNQQEEAFKDFCDFDKEFLNFLPIRIEEIFLLKVTDLFKMTKINEKDYRVFFLKANELKKFIKILESEVQK